MSKLRALLKRVTSDPLRLSRYEDGQIYGRRSDNQITYWVNSGYKTIADRSEKLYLWMFGEDIHLRIMPYSRGEASVSLCPHDTVTEQIVIKGMGRSSYTRSLQEVIEEFVRNTTQIIYSYGEAYYEIEYIQNGEQTDFKLHLIYTPSIKKVLGNYIQVITPAAAKHAHIKIGLVRVPKKKILHITSPSELGGARGLKKIMNGLISHGSLPTPPFLRDSLSSWNPLGFNLEDYDLNRFIYRAQLTKDFGWSQRKDANSPLLEYYWLTRVLRQAKALVIIRENIVDELNKVLNREIFNDGQRIQIKGPYNLKDIKEAEDKLMNGKLKFNDLVKKFL